MPGWLHDLFSLNGGLQAAGARPYRPRRCSGAPAKLAGIQSTSREGGGREGARASPRTSPPPVPHRGPSPPARPCASPRIPQNTVRRRQPAPLQNGHAPRAPCPRSALPLRPGLPRAAGASSSESTVYPCPGHPQRESSRHFSPPWRLCCGPGGAEPLSPPDAMGSPKPEALAARRASPGPSPTRQPGSAVDDGLAALVLRSGAPKASQARP